MAPKSKAPPFIKQPSTPIPKLSFSKPGPGDIQPILNIIATSILDQRSAFLYALLIHPYTITGVIFSLVFIQQWLWQWIFRLSAAGAVTAIVAYFVTSFAAQYITAADKVKGYGELYFENEQKDRETGKKIQRESIVAKSGEKVIGVVVWDVIHDDPAPVEGAAKDRVEIVALNVDAKYRHRGLGMDLMEKPVDRAWEAIGPLASVYVITKHANSLRPMVWPTWHRQEEVRDHRVQNMLDAYMRYRKERYQDATKDK